MNVQACALLLAACSRTRLHASMEPQRAFRAMLPCIACPAFSPHPTSCTTAALASGTCLRAASGGMYACHHTLIYTSAVECAFRGVQTCMQRHRSVMDGWMAHTPQPAPHTTRLYTLPASPQCRLCRKVAATPCILAHARRLQSRCTECAVLPNVLHCIVPQSHPW